MRTRRRLQTVDGSVARWRFQLSYHHIYTPIMRILQILFKLCPHHINSPPENKLHKKILEIPFFNNNSWFFCVPSPPTEIYAKKKKKIVKSYPNVDTINQHKPIFKQNNLLQNIFNVKDKYKTSDLLKIKHWKRLSWWKKKCICSFYFLLFYRVWNM